MFVLNIDINYKFLILKFQMQFITIDMNKCIKVINIDLTIQREIVYH